MATEKSKDYYARCLSKALKRIERCNKDHGKRCKQYDLNERAYKGIIEGMRQGRWNHAVHPPYIFEVIETMESGLIDDATITKVFPNKPNQEKGADALERTLKQQAEKANLDEQKGAFTKSALVYGIGILKTQWLEQRGPQTRRVWVDGVEQDPVTETVTHFDGPVSDNIDPRDFMWDPSATSMDNAEYVIYRYWADRSFVKDKGMAEEGEQPLWMNVDDLLESRSTKDPGTTSGRALDKNKVDVDHCDEFEIHEIWTRDNVVVIGNQSVLLQDDPSPFWHNELPFQVGVTLTDLNRFEGQSEVTVLIALQNALWDILNQNLDNLELANNGIIQVSSDVDDPDSFQFFPGARWIVDRPGQDVTMWEPNSRILNSSQGITESLKGDLQSLAAALPYLSGAGGDTVDQKTATGISIISNMAQRRILRKKALLGYAYKRMGRQWIALNQQFMTMPLAVRIDGPNGIEFEHILPQEIQGEYDYFVESMTESLDRQQKRTEALDLLQQFATIVPALPMFAAAGLNKKAFIEKVLSAFDIQNPDNFLVPDPPPQPQLPPALAQQLGPGGPPQAPPSPNGVYQAPQIAASNPLLPPA